MAKKRLIELFTAGCPICEPTVRAVQAFVCPECEVKVYNVAKGCQTNECRDKANEYGVSRLPAVAVNGKLLECCQQGGLNLGLLQTAAGCA